MTPESMLSIGVGLALAAAAGFRVFVPLLVLSLAARTDALTLADGFAWIGTTPATLVFATATVIEVAAYYVPLLDNVLDAVATPAAVAAGALASASLVTDLPPWLHYSLALIAAGGTAAIVQTSTAVTRLGSTGATGGLGNFVVATVELLGAGALALAAVLLPLVAPVLAIGLIWILLRRRGRRARHLVPAD